MKTKLQDKPIQRYPALQKEPDPSLQSTFLIKALTKKRADKKENEDSIGISCYGIYQKDTYLEGMERNRIQIAVADGVSATRPYASAASYEAVLSFFNGLTSEEMNCEVAETFGKTTLDGIDIDRNLLTLTHIGDSSVYLIRRGKVIPLTFPHDRGQSSSLENACRYNYSILDNYLGKDDDDFNDLETGRCKRILEDGDLIYLMSDGVEKLFWSVNFYRHMKKGRLMNKVKKKRRFYDDTSLIEVKITIKKEA